MCAALVERGHTVVGCARDAAALRSIQQQYGNSHRFDSVDVTQCDAVTAWAHSVIETHGAPDLVVNNAGVINRNARLWDVPPDDFQRVLQVNVAGPYHVLRAFLPAMRSRRQGGIVNFSSSWGSTTSPEVAPYCASKWAIEGLTQALAQELSPPLFAVAFNPGIIHTDMLRSCFGGSASSYPSPDQWAESAVPFLLQLDARDNGSSVCAPGV